MNDKELVFEEMRKNNGIIEAQTAAKLGINNKTLQRMHNAGEIERIVRGMYIDPNYLEDKYLITQYRCKKGIYSHETALYFHELSDRTPFSLMMTIPSGYNTRLLTSEDSIMYKFFYSNKKQYSIGKIELLSPFGNNIAVYDKERTICDCIRKIDQLDTDLVNTAIKSYMRDNKSQYSKLLKYADTFKVRETVRQYMEMLS